MAQGNRDWTTVFGTHAGDLHVAYVKEESV